MSIDRDTASWFPKLPEDVRGELLAAPDAALTSRAFHAIVLARGFGPASAHFVDAGDPPPASLYLEPDVRAWLHEQRGDGPLEG